MNSGIAESNPKQLHRRDILLLPLLALLTVGLISAGVVSYANHHYHASKSTVYSCLVLDDRSTGVRAIPNSTCSQNTGESGDVLYRFNACGHRAGMPCGPKSTDTFRIVMIGSSANFGLHVDRDKTFAALLPPELTHLTGRKVEVYNEAMVGGFPYSAGLRLDEVLAAQPDMVLWVLLPRDIRNASAVLLSDLNPPARAGSKAKGLRGKIKEIFADNSIENVFPVLSERALISLRSSATGTLLQTLLYESQSQYVKSYLMAPETDANTADVGFMKVRPSARWQSHVNTFDDDAARIENRLTQAGVPVVVTFVPERGQAAMIAMRSWPAGFDPYKLADEVRSIVTRHGARYVDILRDYQNLVNPERGFFPVDGHPDADGHAVIAALLANRLTDGSIPKLDKAPTTVFAPPKAQ